LQKKSGILQTIPFYSHKHNYYIIWQWITLNIHQILFAQKGIS